MEAEICFDHVHMLLEIPLKVAISRFLGYLKGKSNLMLYEQLPACNTRIRIERFGVEATM